MTQAATGRSPDYLAQLLQLGQLLTSSLDLKQVLETAIDEVIAFVGAERGFILLVETETGRVWGEAVRGLERAALEDTLSGKDPTNHGEISRTLVESVLDTRQPVLSHNAMEDPRFSGRQSVQLAHLRSVLCVPLIAQSRLLGVIYLDSRAKTGVFGETHLSMLAAFASQASVALENARLYENLKRSLEERLQLQDELHKQETNRLALEEAARLKTEFVGFVAHELRNPLTTIQGAVQTLLGDSENRIDQSTRKELLEAIEVDSGRLVEMIDELLDISRIEAGRSLSLHIEEVDLRKLLNRQAAKYRHYPQFTPRHRLKLDLAGDLPGIVQADETKIGQIVGNLLSNAIKYSPKGGEIALGASFQEPSDILITVSDPGIGLSEAQRKRLFRQYDRIERKEIERIPGSGLGLYLVKHLVSLHGGEISCESSPGKGTRFIVRLPIANRQAGG
ncbi:MAG TPA: GAF domain-containing sensor histidine kinase [Chthonomonadales bacterium]|nr:GAF domain-containing sensor histidine kinase [Chthonomonadales bacterium]